MKYIWTMICDYFQFCRLNFLSPSTVAKSTVKKTGTMEENEIPGFLEISAELIILILETVPSLIITRRTATYYGVMCYIKGPQWKKPLGYFQWCFFNAFIDRGAGSCDF